MLRLEALEVPFGIRCAGEGAQELAESVRAAWDWCLAEAEAPAAVTQTLTIVLERDQEQLSRAPAESSLRGTDVAILMDRLSPLVTREAIAERRTDLVMIHGCAVADPASGDTVVLYGPSGAGKTTLARTLCTDFAYLTDETAGVTADFGVVPYPKPLSIIMPVGQPLKEQVSPGRLGLVRSAHEHHPLKGLVQLNRDPAHVGDPLLELLPTVNALPELTAQTSYTREMDRPLHRLAALAEHVGGVRRVTYAEAEQLRGVVGSILAGQV